MFRSTQVIPPNVVIFCRKGGFLVAYENFKNLENVMAYFFINSSLTKQKYFPVRKHNSWNTGSHGVEAFKLF